jgi:hypothetical protein
VCVVLCTVFHLIVVLYCVMYVVCVLCLIVVPLPPGENPFAVKNIYLSIYLYTTDILHIQPQYSVTHDIMKWQVFNILQ